MQVLSLSPGAFLALPGLVGAVVIVAIYVRRHRLPLDGFADALAPGILLTLAIASLGSFLSGSVLGAVSQAPWGVEMFGVTRQPAALLEALVLLALLGALLQRTIGASCVRDRQPCWPSSATRPFAFFWSRCGRTVRWWGMVCG